MMTSNRSLAVTLLLLASRCLCIVCFTPFFCSKYRSFKSDLHMAFRQEFGAGGKVLLAVSIACLLKARLSTIEVRSTTVCPSGPGYERVLNTFKSNDNDYHCLPLGEWVKQIIVAPVVLPGSADWDSTAFQGPRGLPDSVPLDRH